MQSPGPSPHNTPAAVLARYNAEDPCFRYRPSPTQARFHASPAYFKLVTGGGRSGKTTSCLVDLAMCLRGIHPYKKPLNRPMTALIFSITRQQAAMVSQRKLFTACEFPDPPLGPGPAGLGQRPMIPAREIKETGALKVGFRTIYDVTLHNGSRIYFAWSDADDTWKHIQGVKIDYIYIDENAGSKKLLIECRKRVLDSQNDNDWAGCMTWGGTGTEVNDAFEDYRARCLDPLDKAHEIFRIERGENKTISPAALDRFAATLTEEEKKIHITGEDTSAGLIQIYGKQWSDDRHMNPVDYVPKDSDNLWLAYDPGVTHPMGMLITAIRKEEPITLNCIKFWSAARQTLDHSLLDLERYLCGRKLAGIIYDNLAAARDHRGRSLLMDLQTELERLRMTPIVGYFRAEKAHWDGIQLVRHMLDPDPLDPSVAPLIRLNSSAESGCQLARYQLCKYRGKEATRFTGEGGVVKKEDEFCDLVRYQAKKRAAWNVQWACGAMTMVPRDGARPEAMVTMTAEQEAKLTPYERHMRLSRSRKRTSSFRVRDF